MRKTCIRDATLGLCKIVLVVQAFESGRKGWLLTDVNQDLDFFEQASDYVAGFLNEEESHAFERALAQDVELQREVDRCRLHFDAIGVHAPEPELDALSNFRREIWGENWMPWRRRIRIWEFALGGIAASLLAYVVYNSALLDPAPSEILQARLESAESQFEFTVAIDPVGQVALVRWAPQEPPLGMRYDLWVTGDAENINLGALKPLEVQRIEVARSNIEHLIAGREIFVTLEEANADASLAGQKIARGVLRAYPQASR
ncbi:hypothetical protein [Planktotalea sp.]|uniref:hypothetical protein n=1 Tax=Planktotalea sp. TaxID=2029877 RepID=UPI003D6BE8AF